MKNKCFICNIHRDDFEKYNVSFDNHIKYEHNLWNYVYFIIYLNAKNPLDYNGTESYIAEKLEKEDLTWLPLNRAMGLSGAETKEERNVMTIVSEKLQIFEARFNEALARYSQATNNPAERPN